MSDEKNNLPTIAELTGDVELAFKNDQFNLLVNQNPPEKWVKKHPFVSNHLYIPIDKVEHLLKKIFKLYKIEVIKTGMLLNAVEVTVRVHYLHPVTNEWMFHDGVGAQEVQTQKDTGSLKLDMSNINIGAITMALPIAKTVAVKDAADHLGKLFGSDLNRKDTLNYTADKALNTDEKLEELKTLFELKEDKLPEDEKVNFKRIIDKKESRSYKKAINFLAGL
jgi:hypothetical protein